MRVIALILSFIFLFSTICLAKVNINTASKQELISLPYIGESKADNILKYRKEHGEFKSKSDILKVKGIGDKIFEKIKDEICTGNDCK